MPLPGVQVRLLMGSSWGGGDNPAVADALNIMAKARGLDLEARSISYHNIGDAQQGDDASMTRWSYHP